MSDDTDTMFTHAWREAGHQLGIRVVTPHRIGTVTYVAYLPDFGGPRGMVVADLTASDDAPAAAASEVGLYLSRVTDAYATFDAELFEVSLDDWGWYGTEQDRPAWYSGAAWTS